MCNLLTSPNAPRGMGATFRRAIKRKFCFIGHATSRQLREGRCSIVQAGKARYRAALTLLHSSFALRFVKRALPRPCPDRQNAPVFDVLHNHEFRSNPARPRRCARQWTFHAPQSKGLTIATLSGRLNLLLSQLPGRFWAPRSIEPSSSITPGQPIPMKGANFRCFLSAARK